MHGQRYRYALVMRVRGKFLALGFFAVLEFLFQ